MTAVEYLTSDHVLALADRLQLLDNWSRAITPLGGRREDHDSHATIADAALTTNQSTPGARSRSWAM